MKHTFPISELDFKGDTPAEQIRTRRIFEALRTKARQNEFLSEHEKEFFCQGLVLSLHNDGKLEDYTCCDNQKFKFLYLVHYHDLSGASPVYKPNKLLLRETEICDEEKQEDLKYLYAKSDEWKEVINKLNHSELLLQEISKETRVELSNTPKGNNDDLSRQSAFSDEEIELQILLKSKYLYCIALKFFEKISREDLILELNGQAIEIDEYSIIHIMNRHFAAKTIYYDTKKSFHHADFEPEILNKQLREILHQIDISKLYEELSLDKIAFQFKGTDYQIWTGIKKRHVKGKEIEFRRLNTFYPIIEADEKGKLFEKYEAAIINEDIKVYIPK